MKRFMRTLTGKTILFIACVISICIFAASIAGIVFYMSGDGMFYRYSEEKLREKIIGDELGPDWFDDDSESIYYIANGWLRDNNGQRILVEGNVIYPGGKAELFDGFVVRVTDSSPDDEIKLITTAIHIGYSLRYAIFPIALISLILAVILFVVLMNVSGRRKDSDDIVPGPLNKVPFDLMLGVSVTAILCLFAMGVELKFVSFELTVLFLLCTGLAAINVFLGLCMSASCRIKQHNLLKNTVIFRILNAVWKGIKWMRSPLKKLHGFNMTLVHGLPLVWKAGLVFCGITLVEVLITAAANKAQALVVMWFMERIVFLPFILYIALLLKRLQKSGAALAAGDLSHYTDTSGMLWDFKQHGENLNRIAEGMAIAVEDRMKSERMKTELITNVSHDIKTPLTSIINYAGLIGKEPCDNPRICEYSEVLVRQSESLKRLIEDLVEASKASTGNLEVFPAPCDAAVFITQACGEYEEKMLKAELTLIAKQPEKELRIMADGRRMWRIFDNLMNNICKYAQPGTRVYLTLEEQAGNAVISFKNTSREPLDMSEEELMERFTRGDASRNTEGNGLGLSIARSLAELQGGSLRLSVDGDLFKAVLTFPLIA